MKKIVYIVLVLSFISCSSHKRIAEPVIYDSNAEKMQIAFQQAKDKFLMSDSADAIMQDIGWTKRIAKEAKIQGSVPSVYRSINNTGFTIELPCWEYDTEEYYSATVIAEHTNLDSALVRAKVQGVDDIYFRSVMNESFHYNEQKEFILDSIEYTNNYAEYIEKAQFSCLCITKDKKKYIVNATIRIPNTNYISDEEILDKLDFKKFREALEEYKQKHDTINTEKTETPLE